MNLVRDVFAPIRRVLGITDLSTTAVALAFNGATVTFVCASGNIWINPNGTAVADTTSFKLTSGQAIDLVVKGSLSVISDASGATYEYIVWDI